MRARVPGPAHCSTTNSFVGIRGAVNLMQWPGLENGTKGVSSPCDGFCPRAFQPNQRVSGGVADLETRAGFFRNAAFALSVLPLAACGPSAPEAPPKPHVSVAYPIVKQVIDWDDFIGRFEAIQDVTVTPRVSGAISEVRFRNGQDVKAGQPLFIVDPRPF